MGGGGYAHVLWPVIRGRARGRREVPTGVVSEKCPCRFIEVSDQDVELDLSRLPTTKKAPLVAGPDVVRSSVVAGSGRAEIPENLRGEVLHNRDHKIGQVHHRVGA
jgi:hypothetical protein